MKYKWLNKENNNKLIIFFNGWGMDEGVVKHLKFDDYDVVMFYDYNTLDTDFVLDKKYPEVNIVAWSMGVNIAGVNIAGVNTGVNTGVNRIGVTFGNISKIVVINGTLKPIDEKYGIPPRIYDMTIAGFDEKSRDKFINNMGINSKDISYLLFNRTLENQKSELLALKNYKANLEFKPAKIYISEDDRIIPTKNQCAFWGIEPNLKGGHYPFLNFARWGDIL